MTDETYLNSILNATTISDAAKAFLISTADKPAAEVQDALLAVAAAESADNPEALEGHVAAEYLKLKVRREAERRLAGEGFEGSTELTWADLDDLDGTFIVQDLVPDASLCFLVARPNVGKTFAYIDMVCSMVYGLPWLGKETRQAKVTIVIGEGRNGFKSRMLAWAADHEVDPDEIPKWVTFIDGANLMNDESLARVKAVADRHGTELVIWDTYANVAGTLDNDKDALTTLAVSRALAVRKDTAHLFVHHPTKASEDSEKPILRGSGALSGRAEVVMTMYRDKRFTPRQSKVKREWLAISTEMDHAGKNRPAPNETIRALYLDKTDDNKAVFRQAAEESITRGSAAVQKHLVGIMTIDEFVSASGISKTTARRYLAQAVEEGIALKMPGVKRDEHDQWWLAGTDPPEHNWEGMSQV